MKRNLMVTSALAALLLGVTATPAMAGTNADLLKRLHEKGILTDEEYNELAGQEQAESEAPAPAMASAEAALDDKRAIRMTETGIGFEAGGVAIKFSGSVNGFYVHDNGQTPGPNTAVTGGVVPGGGSVSAIRNGLLPGFFKVDVTTQQGGWDVGAHFGMYPGINSSSYAGGANSGGFPAALQTTGIDFRQTYLTIGRKGLGEFKLGRDIGLFASEGILNDITLLSVGSTGGNVAPSNTSLGRIGAGYIYTDFQPQITYSSPNMGGFQAAIGVFQPLQSLTGPGETGKSPGFQGKLTYDGKFGGVGARLWLSGISQKHDRLVGADYTGSGFDTGAKITVGPISLVGYYYSGSGLGTTALNLFDTDAAGNKRDSDGFYAQALATFGKLSVGGSYGESRLDYANAADALANPTLVDTNSSYVAHARYGLTSWVTLIGEYIHTKSEAHNGNQAEADTVALGAILFF